MRTYTKEAVECNTQGRFAPLIIQYPTLYRSSSLKTHSLCQAGCRNSIVILNHPGTCCKKYCSLARSHSNFGDSCTSRTALLSPRKCQQVLIRSTHCSG